MKFKKVKDPPNFVFWHYEIIEEESRSKEVDKNGIP